MSIFIRDPIHNLAPAQREQLRAMNIVSAHELAKRVLENRDFLDQFDAEMRRRMVIVIAHVTMPRARSAAQAFYPRHALDILLVLVGLLAGAAVWRDFCIPNVSAVVVQRPGGLPPFHVIAPADVALSKPNANEAEIIGDLNGRYSSVYIAVSKPIAKEKLSKGSRLSTELNDRVIVRLKTQSTNVFSGMVPPYRAVLIVAPHERGVSALFLNDVFVLDLQADGDGLGAVLALPSSDESTLAAFMARSDFFLAVHQD